MLITGAKVEVFVGVEKKVLSRVEFMGVFVLNGVEFESFCPF